MALYAGSRLGTNENPRDHSLGLSSVTNPKELIMDPNANIIEQRQIEAAIKDGTATDTDRDRLAELKQALNEWTRSGGFAPTV